MVGKKNLKWKATMLKKFGSEKALKEYMGSLGSKGGKNGTGHEFAHGKFDPAVAGKRGGTVSRRGKVKDGQSSK